MLTDLAGYTGPLPDVHDPMNAPFWAAARKSRLCAQQCQACAAFRWLPAPVCPNCLTSGGVWTDLSGDATVWSYAVYRRAMRPDFKGCVPYTVALLELPEGIFMAGGLAEPVPDIHIGQALRPVFLPVNDEVTLVRWLAAGES